MKCASMLHFVENLSSKTETTQFVFYFRSPLNLLFMKKNNANNPFCMLFGHNYFVENKNENSSTLRCKSCKKEFVLDAHGNLIDATENHTDPLFTS